MAPEKKLFLLDAYALIFRAYYAFINRPIRNSKGLNTSAIFGFISTLDEVLRKEKPTHIAVAFDPPVPTFRHEMFEPYKANREATPPDIKLSVPYIKQVLEAYNIPMIEVDGYEADDVIGTMAKKAKTEGYEVYMMTPDKDYAQLVEDGIYMFKPRRSGNDSEILGVNEIKENFSVDDPIQVIDILALWGDASDNIPGAPGIGEKTAKKLISKYASIEGLFDNLSDLKGKQKENLENNIEQIRLSKVLATIVLDVPVNISIEELEYKDFNRDKLKDLFEELEFRTLSQRILGTDTKPTVQSAQGTLFDIPETISNSESKELNSYNKEKVEYIQVNSTESWQRLLAALNEAKEFCFDTETTGLDVIQDEIVGLAIAVQENEAYYLPLGNDRDSATNELDKLKQFFENKTTIKIGHNLKFDIQVLRNYNISVSGPYFDTMVAHYLLHPEGRHKLDILCETLLNYKTIPIEELIGKKGKNQITMRQVDLDKATVYACEDADLTMKLYHKLKPDLEHDEIKELASSIEFPLIDVLTDIELAGFNLNVPTLKEFEKNLENEILAIRSKIYEYAGEEFNIASPKQLGIILFEKLKISSNARLTKTKQYSTGEEVLQRLKDTHPIINQILEFRSLSKLNSTYVSALPKLINNKTDRIHSSFNQTIAATGRLSSVNPNLQNIPIREERGREIRKSFIPANPEYCILSADYSQIELRIMAHLSEDEHMVQAFRNGADIHRSTAANIYKIADKDVTREMRSKAKTANFGIIYGISAFGLSQRLSIPRTEAKDLIDSYFNTFPKVKEYMDASIQKAKDAGYVTTIFGRRRYLPDIHASNSVVRGVAERNAINSPIQGSAADIIKIAMINIHQKLKTEFKTKMILQVHDELVFDVYKPELEAIKALVKNEMENATKLIVPLDVDMGVGDNWLEAH